MSRPSWPRGCGSSTPATPARPTPVDAHAVAMAALRTPKLKVLAFDEELVALRLLADRRDELSARRVQTVNRLHRLLTELIPGGAPRDLSATKAKRLLATVKPRTLVGKTTRRMAAEEMADLVARRRQAQGPEQASSSAAVLARGSHLMDLHGIGPAGRRPDPGRRRRHRPVPRPQPLRVLDRHRTPGRLLRRAHPAPAVPGREPADEPRPAHRRDRPDPPRHRRPAPTTGASWREAKTRKEALRCLKRRLSDLVYRQLVADAIAGQTRSQAGQAGPGGHSGASSQSSAADLHTPVIGSSDQPQPGPAAPTLPAHDHPRTPRAASAPQPPRRRAGAVKVERPTGRTTLTATSAGAHSERRNRALDTEGNRTFWTDSTTASRGRFGPPREPSFCARHSRARIAYE